MPRRNRRVPQPPARPIRLIPPGLLVTAAREHLQDHLAALVVNPDARSLSGDPDACWPAFCSAGPVLDPLALHLAGIEPSDAAGNLAA